MTTVHIPLLGEPEDELRCVKTALLRRLGLPAEALDITLKDVAPSTCDAAELRKAVEAAVGGDFAATLLAAARVIALSAKDGTLVQCVSGTKVFCRDTNVSTDIQVDAARHVVAAADLTMLKARLMNVHEPLLLWNEQQAVKCIEKSLRPWMDAAGCPTTISNEYDVTTVALYMAAAAIGSWLAAHVAKFVNPPLDGCSPPVDGQQASGVSPVSDALGVANPSVKIHFTNLLEGNVVLLAQPVPAFAPVIRIPADQLVHARSCVTYSSCGKALATYNSKVGRPVVDDEAILLLTLVFERFVAKEKSHFRALIDGIPATFPFVPLFWDHTLLAELEGSPLLEETVAKKAQMEQFVSDVHTHLMQPIIHAGMTYYGAYGSAVKAAFSFNNILWARAAIDSRSFTLNYGTYFATRDGEAKTGNTTEEDCSGSGEVLITMAPLADMLNHDNKSHILSRRIDHTRTGDFLLSTFSDLTTDHIGREIKMSYGPLQNWELLLQYGFVIDNNPYETVQLDLVGEADGAEENNNNNNNEEEEEEEEAQQQEKLGVGESNPSEGAPPSQITSGKTRVGRRSSQQTHGFTVPATGIPTRELLDHLRGCVVADDDTEEEAPQYTEAEIQAFVCHVYEQHVQAVLDCYPTAVDDDVQRLSSLLDRLEAVRRGDPPARCRSLPQSVPRQKKGLARRTRTRMRRMGPTPMPLSAGVTTKLPSWPRRLQSSTALVKKDFCNDRLNGRGSSSNSSRNTARLHALLHVTHLTSCFLFPYRSLEASVSLL